MEKKEKLEQIYRLAQELGVSLGEVVDYFSAKVGRRSTTQEILPGAYVYADGSISDKIVEGQQIKAVVGYVEEGMVYAVCLRQARLSWSKDFLPVPETEEMVSGKEATQKILEAARTQEKRAEAAQWCYNYAKDGVKPGEAFLASLSEWKKILADKNAINDSLKTLGVSTLGGYYWSSNEHLFSDNSWMLGSNGRNYSDSKDRDCGICAIIAFRI